MANQVDRKILSDACHDSPMSFVDMGLSENRVYSQL